jgi:hypothetical protein
MQDDPAYSATTSVRLEARFMRFWSLNNSRRREYASGEAVVVVIRSVKKL